MAILLMVTGWARVGRAQERYSLSVADNKFQSTTFEEERATLRRQKEEELADLQAKITDLELVRGGSRAHILHHHIDAVITFAHES